MLGDLSAVPVLARIARGPARPEVRARGARRPGRPRRPAGSDRPDRARLRPEGPAALVARALPASGGAGSCRRTTWPASSTTRPRRSGPAALGALPGRAGRCRPRSARAIVGQARRPLAGGPGRGRDRGGRRPSGSREAVPRLVAMAADEAERGRGHPGPGRVARPPGPARLPRRPERPRPRGQEGRRVGPGRDPRPGGRPTWSRRPGSGQVRRPGRAGRRADPGPVHARDRLEGDRPLRQDHRPRLFGDSARSTSAGPTPAPRGGRRLGGPHRATRRPAGSCSTTSRGAGRPRRVRLRHQRLARPRGLRFRRGRVRPRPRGPVPGRVERADQVTVNDRPVLNYDNFAGRPFAPDGDLVRVSLKKGKNRILVKTRQGVGAWSFGVQVSEARRRSRSPEPKLGRASRRSGPSPSAHRGRPARAARRSSSTPRESAA